MLFESICAALAMGATVIAAWFSLSLVPWKRVGSIVRSHLPSRRRMRKLSIDMAMHTLADVDMEWWDEKFNALVRAGVPDVSYVLSNISHMPSWERIEQKSSITQVGGVTYISNPASSVRMWDTESETDRLVEQGRRIRAKAEALLAEMEADSEECPNCGYADLTTYADTRVRRLKSWRCDACRRNSRRPDVSAVMGEVWA